MKKDDESFETIFGMESEKGFLIALARDIFADEYIFVSGNVEFLMDRQTFEAFQDAFRNRDGEHVKETDEVPLFKVMRDASGKRWSIAMHNGTYIQDLTGADIANLRQELADIQHRRQDELKMYV